VKSRAPGAKEIRNACAVPETSRMEGMEKDPEGFWCLKQKRHWPSSNTVGRLLFPCEPPLILPGLLLLYHAEMETESFDLLPGSPGFPDSFEFFCANNCHRAMNNACIFAGVKTVLRF
jgi:hypothetical protein